MIVSVYAIIVTVFWVAACLYILINRSRVKHLRSVKIHLKETPPVVMIVPVRNEEAELANALKSICNLDYDNYRLLLINDRSTDGTAAIMKSYAAQYKNITIVTIDELPQGWLGKNHALYKGYQLSSEEWMLFTDADVVFQPDTLKKAMTYCLDENLDHLTILPFVRSRSEWLNSVLATFAMMLEIKQRPWDVGNPKSKASLGIGAFNLVKRKAYEKAGTHKAIALRPDDDLKLGERMKQSGGRQGALYGNGQLSLEWYTNVKEFINGLMKNTFSVYNYNFWKMMVTGVVPVLLIFILPLPVLLIAADGDERWLIFVIVVFQWMMFRLQPGGYAKGRFALMIPFAGLLMMYIMLRSAIVTLKQNGIYWRDRFYSLTELRKNK